MSAADGGLLSGKRLLVTGVATTDSIAFATAAAAQRQGAEVALGVFPVIWSGPARRPRRSLVPHPSCPST